MPTIPIYRQQTDVSGVPNLGRIDPSAAAAPAAALERVGQQGMQWADERRQEFDTLRAEEAFNKLRERQMSLMLDPEKGFTTVKSGAAVQRPLMQEYSEAFNKAQNEIASSLQSESQRQLFQRRAAGAGLEFKNALMRHVLEQSNQYREEVFSGTLQVETNRAATEWNNPLTIQASLDRITSAVGMRAKSDGLAADKTDALLRNARSQVHSIVIASALEAGNVGYAEQYLKANAEQMSGLDLLKVRGLVKKEADTRVALGTATEVVQGAVKRTEPGDFGRLWNLLEHQESSGNQAAVSPKGAVGVAQVMPTTGPEAARLAGLPWDEQRLRTDAAYNRALGQAYFAKQLQTFGGDAAKALAAYNAGPGAVGNAIAKSEAKGGDWLALLPKETQDYVAAILPKFGAGDGAPARPTLEEIHQQVRQRVGIDNPERLKLALDESTRQWNDANAARKQREDEALGDAYRLLESNGGRWDALPASLKARVPADKFGSLREYAGKVSKGEPVETDWQLFDKLYRDPAALRAENLPALKHRIGETELKQLIARKADLEQDPNAVTRLYSTQQRFNDKLGEIGVDPTPKDNDEAGHEKIGRLRSMLDANIAARERDKGKKLTPDELYEEVDKLFAKVNVKGWFGRTPEKRVAELKPGDEVVVPADERKKIERDLKAEGMPVTEEAVLTLYFAKRGIVKP